MFKYILVLNKYILLELFFHSLLANILYHRNIVERIVENIAM